MENRKSSQTLPLLETQAGHSLQQNTSTSDYNHVRQQVINQYMCTQVVAELAFWASYQGAEEHGTASSIASPAPHNLRQFLEVSAHTIVSLPCGNQVWRLLPLPNLLAEHKPKSHFWQYHMQILKTIILAVVCVPIFSGIGGLCTCS